MHTRSPARDDYDPLLELIGSVRFALIGEASHGTHEFYRERTEITQATHRGTGLCSGCGRGRLAWAYRVNRYVRRTGPDVEVTDALAGFERFPTWMWRNTVVLDFIDWLRDYNDALPSDKPKVGFYGLDLYSLYTSAQAVLRYLDKVDPEAAQRARYRCGRGRLLLRRTKHAAGEKRRAVLPHYVPVRRLLVEPARPPHGQHADRARSAPRRPERPAKIAVWEHNSHLGDARATEMRDRGELNVGQLTRERYGNEAVLLGLTTYSK